MPKKPTKKKTSKKKTTQKYKSMKVITMKMEEKQLSAFDKRCELLGISRTEMMQSLMEGFINGCDDAFVKRYKNMHLKMLKEIAEQIDL